jgi:hypothetical protein
MITQLIVVDPNKLNDGQLLHVRTRNTTYVIQKVDGELFISGHPEIFPYAMRAVITEIQQGDRFHFALAGHSIPNDYPTSRVHYILEVTE